MVGLCETVLADFMRPYIVAGFDHYSGGFPANFNYLCQFFATFCRSQAVDQSRYSIINDLQASVPFVQFISKQTAKRKLHSTVQSNSLNTFLKKLKTLEIYLQFSLFITAGFREHSSK